MSDEATRANDRLQSAIDTNSVLTADIPTLISLLKDESEVVSVLNPKVKERNPKRAQFIRELIDIRQKERTLKHEGIKSSWTIGISAATFLLLAIKMGYDITEEIKRKSPESKPAESLVSQVQEPVILDQKK
jgi:hypothetical protein